MIVKHRVKGILSLSSMVEPAFEWWCDHVEARVVRLTTKTADDLRTKYRIQRPDWDQVNSSIAELELRVCGAPVLKEISCRFGHIYKKRNKGWKRESSCFVLQTLKEISTSKN